jgi:hypothetical protein
MAMRAIALAKASCGYSLPSETFPSPYEAAMATVALAAFSMSDSNFIFPREQKGSDIDNNLGMKKSSIDGKQYLDYL